jgi:hypothetical protein
MASRGTMGPRPHDPNDTSGSDMNLDPDEGRVWCCEWHKMATNRATRRFADKWCPERKRAY